MIGFTGQAGAQSVRQNARQSPPPVRLESVPGPVLDAARRDDERGRDQVGDYLCQPLPDRNAVITRGLSLMYELDRQLDSATTDQKRKQLIDQQREAAARCACAAMVINTSYDREFLPERTTIGFDLQPQGAPLARGFTPIAAGDPRLNGGSPVSRPSTNPWIGDAVNGISGFSTALPNGRWRVIVMTDKQGANVRQMPFGRMISANRGKVYIAEMPPERWLIQGYLTNKLVTPGLASAGGSALNGVALLGANDLLPDEGGSIVFEVDVTDGTLRLGFQRPASLAAIVIEPAERRTSLPLVGEAQNAPAVIDRCFEYTRQLDQYAPRRYLGAPKDPDPPGGNPTSPN